MKNRFRVLAILAMAGLLTGAGVKEPTNTRGYTIKYKSNPDVGKASICNRTMKTSTYWKVVDQAGMVVKESTEEVVEEEEFTTTVLEGGTPRPRKYSRAYTKASKVQMGKATPHSYQGRTVLFELKGDKYVLSVEGQPLDDVDQSELTRQANGSMSYQDLVPGQGVHVGKPWAVEDKVLARTVKHYLRDRQCEFDPARSKGEGKLVKVWKQEGQQLGSVTISLKLAFKKMESVSYDSPLVVETNISMDRPIDGSSHTGSGEMKVQMAGKGQTERDGKKYTVELKYTYSSRQTVK